MKHKGFNRYIDKRLLSLKFTLLGTCFLGILGISFSVQGEEAVVVDRIVAEVNTDVITLYDLDRAFSPFAENIKSLGYSPEKERQSLFQARQDILNQLIDGKLADQEIKRYQLDVSQKEIDTTVERMKEARHLTDEQLREALAQQGLTMEEYRNEIKESILRTKLVNREVKSKIVITKEDVRAYFDNHPEKFGGETKYHLWNIYAKVPATADPSERATARSALESILAKLQRGDSFETIVEDLRSSSSFVQGTDLGLFLLEELSENLREVVKKMKAGEHSDVLDTDFGYQILYVENIIDLTARPFEEVQSEIEDMLYKEFVDNRYLEWLDDLRRRSHIKIIN
jgi:peptidyl-prolyl cis-trans isomerase SurA